jgi:hypothetical protein
MQRARHYPTHGPWRALLVLTITLLFSSIVGWSLEAGGAVIWEWSVPGGLDWAVSHWAVAVALTLIVVAFNEDLVPNPEYHRALAWLAGVITVLGVGLLLVLPGMGLLAAGTGLVMLAAHRYHVWRALD